FGLTFEDLYDREGLVRLDAAFLGRLAARDEALAARLEAARREPSALAPKEESTLLLELVPHLDAFVGELFGIQKDLAALEQRHRDLAPLFEVKRQFVQRRPVSGVPAAEAAAFDGDALTRSMTAALGIAP